MTQGDKKPPRFKAGDKLSASVLNSLADSVLAIIRRMYGAQISQPLNLQVILSGDLLAAVDTLTDPSYAQAVVLRKKPNGDMETTTRQITIVNRFENISVDADTYAKAEWIDGEWQLYAADCQPGSITTSAGGDNPSESGFVPVSESL